VTFFILFSWSGVSNADAEEKKQGYEIANTPEEIGEIDKDNNDIGRSMPISTLTENRNIELLISDSQDYTKHKSVFSRATKKLINTKKCKNSDFSNQGWRRSTLEQSKKVYFIYCGKLSRDHLVYLDVDTGEIY